VNFHGWRRFPNDRCASREIGLLCATSIRQQDIAFAAARSGPNCILALKELGLSLDQIGRLTGQGIDGRLQGMLLKKAETSGKQEELQHPSDWSSAIRARCSEPTAECGDRVCPLNLSWAYGPSSRRSKLAHISAISAATNKSLRIVFASAMTTAR
jgi:hypothetical protein